jgi:hypothetical protein
VSNGRTILGLREGESWTTSCRRLKNISDEPAKKLVVKKVLEQITTTFFYML